MSEPIRIFIGTEPKTAVACKVLEHSIRSNTHADVEVTPMIGPEWEYSIAGIKVGTGFSLRRWMIPAACNWQGKAIYLDADQLVFGDIQQLWLSDQRPTVNGTSDATIWCTWQTDKYSPSSPVPQTSVMLIDCNKAFEGGGWQIDQVLDLLRSKPDAKTYGDFMHGMWLLPRVARIREEWNHLCKYEEGVTKLLHYTKEPQQPWYDPYGPLASHWQKALEAAVDDGAVTNDDLEKALAKWNRREDHRKMNGMHPFYRKYVKKAPKTRPRVAPFSERRVPPPTNRILWTTAFASDMFAPSGRPLLESFLAHHVVGDMLVATEGIDKHEISAVAPCLMHYDLDKDTFLSDWLRNNADIIPEHLGGKHHGRCECPGGPFDVHDKRHKMPCVGHWFNRNTSRWFRKIAAQRAALSVAELHNYDVLIWLDADCRFRRAVTADDVNGFFKGQQNAVFYLKNRRPVMEAGVLGFRLRLSGDIAVRAVVENYRSGTFRRLKRWDDSAVYQFVIQGMVRNSIPCVDVAYDVGPNAAVVSHSPLGPFLEHAKGRHGRGMGIMT